MANVAAFDVNKDEGMVLNQMQSHVQSGHHRFLEQIVILRTFTSMQSLSHELLY